MTSLIIETVWNSFIEILLPAALIALGLTFLCYLLYDRKKGTKGKMVVIASHFFLAFYLCYVVYITLLTREAGSRVGISLHFFETYAPDMYSQSYMIENLLLFIPMGILLPLNIRAFRHAYVSMPTFLGLSLMIESVQLVTRRGYFQVDDIWLNVLGGLLGYIIWYLTWRCIDKIRK